MIPCAGYKVNKPQQLRILVLAVVTTSLSLFPIIFYNFFLTQTVKSATGFQSNGIMTTSSSSQTKVNRWAENSTHILQLDLFIFLTGRLGNNLLEIAYGKIIQLLALEDGRFNFTIRCLWNTGMKTEISVEELHTCFSKYFSKESVNLMEWQIGTPQWKKKVQEQNHQISTVFPEWEHPMLAAEMLTFVDSTIESIQSKFDLLANVINRMEHYLPFVLTKSMANIPLIDRYYDELHELFTFNQHQCCRDTPDADETVLHIRGFEVEIPNIVNLFGFKDLNVHQITYELLGHLTEGEKVAVVSPWEEKVLANYTDALRNRGLHVRYVNGQTGPQGFCFLRSATKGLYGDYFSTYFRFAALFSDTAKNITFFNNNQRSDLRSKVPTEIIISNRNFSRKKINFSFF